MASVFITGSSNGLGLMVAKLLVDEGHELALQGRNEARRKSGKVACDRVLGARRRHRSLTLPCCFTTRIRGGAMQGRRHRTDRARDNAGRARLGARGGSGGLRPARPDDRLPELPDVNLQLLKAREPRQPVTDVLCAHVLKPLEVKSTSEASVTSERPVLTGF
jgi:NAD(P)-dependent dehydrogenase (short-subunit alcohol dehydrogenase family)